MSGFEEDTPGRKTVPKRQVRAMGVTVEGVVQYFK